VKITFVTAQGDRQDLAGSSGETVMQVALNADIRQILADCGGAMSCATCHVHVAPEWVDKVGPASAEEEAMLEMAVDPDETSRLSCQIVLRDDLDGLIINLPKSQF
jgi:2Fe-2S ferredoxin